MKTLLIALALIPALSQAAELKVLKKIQLDLDRDGKPDTVSIVEKARVRDPETFQRIVKITLSSRKHSYSYPDLLMDVSSTNPEENCRRLGGELPESVTLRLEAKGNALVVGEEFDANCGRSTSKNFTISLRQGKLMMDKMSYLFSSGAMCDDRSRFAYSIDFVRGEGQEALEVQMDNEAWEDKWKLPQGCSLGLTDMMSKTLPDEMMANGRPACAKNPNR
jgi:hypothetical protein